MIYVLEEVRCDKYNDGSSQDTGEWNIKTIDGDLVAKFFHITYAKWALDALSKRDNLDSYMKELLGKRVAKKEAIRKKEISDSINMMYQIRDNIDKVKEKLIRASIARID